MFFPGQIGKWGEASKIALFSCASVASKGRSFVNSNGFVCVFAWSKGQMGRSVVNSNVFVMSKRRSGVNSSVVHAFAWSKGGNVVNSNVFVCFCMAEGRKCGN